MSELAKTYDPASVEQEINQIWVDEHCFDAIPTASGDPYCIVIPPPNVTGALHLGHAINNTLQDILIRKARMEGKSTVWIPGVDHAGIATQAVVEKQLKEKENKTRHDLGREALVARIWDWKQQYGDRIIMQLKRMGCSCDWNRTRFTLDDMCAKAVRETFFKLFKDGLIYRGKRLVNWDTHLQTSISDDEIYHETVKTFLWHIKYPIEGTDQFVTVATTRPETMLGDTAVAVNSEDPRWNKYIGKNVLLPLTDRKIPIIADDILVDPKFGTGVVKVTPAHDPNDYAVWQRHMGKPDEIALINILNPDGTLNENAGKYAKLRSNKARVAVVEDLKALGLLVKEEPYETQVGHSDRSKTVIEPFLSDQWFVKMAPLAEPALEAVRNGKVKFFPERHAQQYLSWLGEKRDWPVSRQLWWGHRIPVWTKTFSGQEAFIDGWKIQEPLHITRERNVSVAIEEGKFNEDIWRVQICINERPGGEHSGHVRELEERFGFVQDPDVLDTWFSSALWPHSTLGWPEPTDSLKKWYPGSVLVTARDIITLWVARMVMTGIYNMGKVPFAHVAINPTILDGKGERMSKSKGNGVDPVDIIETHGADALRFTMTQLATETQDARLPVKKLPDGRNTSDKFDIGRNFCTKIWNASRFVLSSIASVKIEGTLKLSLADKWILAKLGEAMKEINAALAEYRFDVYARAAYDFFWRDFCDWYVEASKTALKDPAAASTTAQVLLAVLDASLRMLHPMLPFITEKLWANLNETHPNRGLAGILNGCTSKRAIQAAWPKVGSSVDGDVDSTLADFASLQEIIVAIRNVRNEHKADPKKSVPISINAPANRVELVNSNKSLIELLAICKITQVGQVQAPQNSVRAGAAGCDVFIEGLIDPEADKQRQAKKEEDLKKQISALEGRLSNEAYVSKAPPQLVKQSQDQLAALKAELEKILAEMK